MPTKDRSASATRLFGLTSDALRVAAIVGPTAVGKTETSVEVAKALDAEVVSIDSMQIYRGMDVGTAKPTAEERAGIPHHLLDVREPGDEVSVAEFQRLARAAVDDVASRSKLPLLVGGSGLYFRAVVDRLEFPPYAPEVRAEIEAEMDRLGPSALYERLQSLDPRAAARIEPGNARRIARALEVIETTGKPFSADATWDRYESIYDLSVAGLTLERPALYERIEKRVDRMLGEGLVAEAGKVRETGLSRSARQALGYRQVLHAEDPGAVRDEIVRATKRFARRQESWFRSDPRIAWFDASVPGVSTTIAEHFRRHLRLT